MHPPGTDSQGSSVLAPKLAGRYQVARILGKGAQAKVYLAYDTRLKQWRAIKVLAANYLDDDHVRARFEAEAQVMARMSHPNLMRVVDVDHDGRVPFMVMELARCGSVLEWAKRNGAIPPRVALNIAMQACEGLQYAHDQGVVHRDVKPHNILIRDDGRVVLTDFGIAQITDGEHLTATGAAMGTFVFMAPEQRSDAKSVDHRADVYGLGATLYTLLTLRTSAELFFAEARDELLEGIPENLQPVILCACRYEREQRYPSMKAMRDALNVRLAQLPPDPPDTKPLVQEILTVPEAPPDTVTSKAGLDDLISILTTGTASGHVDVSDRFGTQESRGASFGGKTGGFNLGMTGGASNNIEDAPTVMPYRMPDRKEILRTRSVSGNSEASELPDYIDQTTLSPGRARPQSLPPGPPASLPPEAPEARPPSTSSMAPSGFVKEVPPPSAPAPAPAPAEEEVPVSNATRLFVAVAALAMMLVLGAIGSGVVSKYMASSTRAAAGEAMIAQIEQAPTLPDELARAGADGDRLRKLFFGYQDAKGNARVAAAQAYAEAAVAEAKRIDAQGIAGTNAKQLGATLEDFQESDLAWRAAKASRLARLTGDLGAW